MVSFDARSTGERVNVAVLPFLSQRYAVRAAQLIASTPAEMSRDYDDMVREVIANLAESFTPDAVNVVMAHLTVTGGTFGGGERAAQSIFEYHVPASAFPAEAHYVALGHLHRRQTLPAPCPVVYSGSPFAVDFGEQDNIHVVCLVEATPTTPAKITDMPITAGRRLRTVHGTVAELVARADEFGDDFLRVVRPGTDQRGPAGEPSPTRCRTPWRCASTRSSPPSVNPAQPDRQPRRPLPGRAVRRILRRGRRRRRPGAGAVRRSCTTGSPRPARRAEGHACDRCCWTWTASRRSATRPTVDFTDADYFALVGADRVGQVDRHRRHDLRPLRVGAALAGPADGHVRAGPDRQPRHGAAGVRRRDASGTSSPANCGGPRPAA